MSWVQAAAGGTFSLVETVDVGGVKKLWSFGANRFGQVRTERV